MRNRWSAGLSCATFGVSQSFSFQGRKVWVRSSQHAGACEGGHKLLVDELPEVAGTDAILPPEVDQARAPAFAGLCHPYQRDEFGRPA